MNENTFSYFLGLFYIAEHVGCTNMGKNIWKNIYNKSYNY